MNVKKRDEILSIMLPVQENSFLLPNVSIAEIFTLEHTQAVEKNNQIHTGVIGRVQWRQSSLWLFNLNEFISKQNTIFDLNELQKPRVAVVNPITRPELPFYAVLTTKMPRLTRLKSSDFKNYVNSSHDGINFEVDYNGENFLIPDLLFLEMLSKRL